MAIVKQQPELSRDYIVKSLLDLLDQAERPGWWGEVGVSVLLQHGRIVTIRNDMRKTEKGGNDKIIDSVMVK